ncbi:alkene reductase [Bradyrhizobium sp. Ai1a-2]|uniref:alkene reductase n=1 Tax=Bradyrhizobium sp. Ai1a-2 TaxID=196490 RepID=UPI0004206197|nr:alkene reductase [Bradyrhizobium sp. Ai1a-2]
MTQSLFAPLRVGPFRLEHRVLMAPLTRMRASQPGDVPTALNAKYYGQRASKGGLIISEATQISLQGKGFPRTPGIHSDEQAAGWKLVTDAVHAHGGIIFLQLWHTGRISHSSHRPDGTVPVAPSAVRPSGKAYGADFKAYPFEIPRALELHEISGVVEQYRQAATRAKPAGFDGVEVHAANGFLIDQFLQDRTNRRTDRYGGSVANRARFLLEVLDAVESVYGASRVGVRLSPYGTLGDIGDSDPVVLFTYVIEALSAREGAYLHLIEPRSNAGLSDEQNLHLPDSAATLFRASFSGPLIASGGFTKDSAEAAIDDGRADAVAFGRAFIANPDLPRRLAIDAPLNAYDRSTFYGGDERGYTDYPTLGESSARAEAAA